ncbi:Hypothetical transmembrane protein coupled to NADH-ubiquinone oxidoreductase chain 5 homolog [Polaromonas sp. CG9_12]|nr:Hypothetical transmembrane protein coupled to NADH-ubiquinone oxidoreductase chain 5 homolog [Polaromonas sp. CG9_12]
MNAAASLRHPVKSSVDSAVEVACRLIAPTWPLDRFIAVNPYWGWVDCPIEEAAAQLKQLGGSRMHMPQAFYRDAWKTQALQSEHLAQAMAEAGIPVDPTAVIAALDGAQESSSALPLLSDMLDAQRQLSREPAWRSTITHQVSQYCAAYFDAEQADWHPAQSCGLYGGWRHSIAHDHGVALLMKAPEVLRRSQALPADALQAITFVLDKLGVPADGLNDFLCAVLQRINGWASWCAYLRWQARLKGDDDNQIVELLAIRLSWEYLLDDGSRAEKSPWMHWRNAWQRPRICSNITTPDHAALLHRALEIAYQKPLAAALAQPSAASTGRIYAVQAVFCIDVRSEVFRRALESVTPELQTMGFAGFFGLPISYTPLGTTATRPQLPGLLAATLCVTDSCGNDDKDAALAKARQAGVAAKQSRQPFGRLPGSAFTLVEAIGLGYLGKLITRSLPSTSAAPPADHDGLGTHYGARPALAVSAGDTLAQRVSLAEGVLKAMGLRSGFARIVLLAGHGSQSANNPHAAGLDCGACCGQTGEVNARTLAALLNDPALRKALAERHLVVPETTHFLAALHNTTTDEVQLFDVDLVPASHAQDLTHLRQVLLAAGAKTRAERAPLLGLGDLCAQPDALLLALKKRANDWAQTRPEWGLANNAAFIVAPRSRSRDVNLAGRSFLHDYDWQGDADGSILELIMTAPMVVTHWINMQYFASTVDNARYGSGNKVLHNVVGGHIGVFEGNGGDLRIGLPLQSVHDGQKWMHTPLRLSVFIEAPQARIEAVMNKHETVRQLVENRWLHLFRIDPQTNAVESWSGGRWETWVAALDSACTS